MEAPVPEIGYLALALFVILTAFLSLRSLARGGTRRFWLGRLYRFVLPWAAWCLFYWLLGLWRGTVSLGQLTEPFSLLVGPEIHLWFLPFVVIFSPLVLLALRVFTAPSRVWVAALLLAPLATLAIWAHDRALWPAPFIEWSFALTPLLYGLLSAAGQHQKTLGAPLAFVTLATLPASLIWGSVVAPFLLGAALVFEGCWRLSLNHRLVPAMGAVSFGVYLLHPFFMLVWFRLGIPAPLWVGALAVFALSVAATALLRLTRLGRLIA